MRRVRMLALPVAILWIAAACTDAGGDGDGGGGSPAQEENTGSVNVLAAVEPEEADAINALFDEHINADAEFTAEIEASGNFEEQVQIRAEGGTLDVILLPQPGGVVDHAESGNAVSLEDLGFDIAEMEATFGEYFMSLGESGGEHYGIPTNINLKSMVWYPADDFDAAGYEVPTTYDELIALSDQIKADGGTPWCVGFQSEGSTGWPATDWMEDIMLRTAGPDVYDQWVTHEIPFNDPAVVTAGETFGEVMFTDGYVLGGPENTPSVAFGDAPLPMFDDPPGCWLHRQASFINAFFPEGTEAGVDYDWFTFPPIDQEGTLFAGELAVVFSNRPEIVDFLEAFMGEEVQCAMGGVTASSRISPNVNVGPDCYANEILADASVVLTESLEAGTGRFDASDLMPTEVGAGSFWSEMMAYMQGGPGSLQTVLDNIEASWPTE
ncbi:MAG TPA: ABC transporter substrate-binding protein [Actinomycetota bacterium]|nr:ABC transporter substrate-binding protein [Actinomycetota bacterium]